MLDDILSSILLLSFAMYLYSLESWLYYLYEMMENIRIAESIEKMNKLIENIRNL